VTTGLITGLLGLYPYPSVAEVVVWLAYAIPMLAYVLWPQRSRARDRDRSTTPVQAT
jgi:high-affinity iron transporter